MLRLAYRRRKLVHVPDVQDAFQPEAQPRQGFLAQPAFEAIVKHLDDGPALGAWIALETVWRIRSEVVTLTRDRVDVADGCIRPDGAHSKNGQPRTAYLVARAAPARI
jgi:hypothetical protein